MKQKVFTLLTLLVLCVTGAWSDDLCSVTFPAELSSKTGSGIEGTNCTYSYAIEDPTSSGNKKVWNSKTYYKFGSAGNVTITYEAGFQVGDKVTVAMGNQNSSQKNVGFLLKSSSGNGTTADVTGNTATTMEYTLKAADIETGGKTIKIYRGGTNSSDARFYSFSITGTRSGKTQLAGEWSDAAPTFNIGSSATIPTFALTNDPAVAAENYTITYSVQSGSLATVNASTGVTAINTAAAGTATVRATLALTATGEESYELPTPAYFDCVITVAKPKVEVPTYSVGPYDYKLGGYKVTVSCATADATLKYVLTTENPSDGSQSTYFDGGHGTIYTYTAPFYTTGKRIIIQASKDGYDDSYSVKGSRYQISDAPTGTSPEVVIWNVKGNSDGEKNADHGNRAVSIVGGHYAQGNSDFGTNGMKMRVSPNSITTFDGVSATRCMQIKVNKGYLVTKVKFNKIHENSSKVAIPVSNVYVDGVALAGFTPFDIPKSSSSALENKEIDLSGAANGGATSSVILVFGESSATQYNAITTITYARQTEAISTKSERSFATYVTLNDLDFSDASVADNIVAYKATGSTSGVVALTALDKVPAGTPILVKTTTKGDSQNVPYATTAVDPITGNKLVAGDGSTAMGGDSNYDYVLKEDAFHRASAGTVATGKAYLHLDEPAARVLSLEFGDNTTGIQEVNTDKKGLLNGEFYNVAGQRVALPKNGLYIVNGKKVVIK